MIVLSVGMPRAGSGWHYNLVHDLVVSAGGDDARHIRQRYGLQGILTEVNCNIGVLSVRRLSLALVPALMGHTFVIKAHSGPSRWSRLLQNLGQMQIAYIYRDPRDAMLSAYDYGRRALEKGRPNAFSFLKDFDTALGFTLDYVRIWESWMREPNVLHARYEDLLSNYDAEAARLAKFLQLDAGAAAVRTVLEKYRPEQATPDNQKLHFFKGKIGRFREAWTPEQREKMNAAFAPYLARMGYDL